VAPRTPIEQELAEIWRELLRVERVGIYDDFFDLGGHSLLLTQLVSRILLSFQVELPLSTVFDAPTIAEITKAIAAKQIEQADPLQVAQMLKEVKQLSIEQIRALLENKDND
jgi:acyl carrier protein